MEHIRDINGSREDDFDFGVLVPDLIQDVDGPGRPYSLQDALVAPQGRGEANSFGGVAVSVLDVGVVEVGIEERYGQIAVLSMAEVYCQFAVVPSLKSSYYLPGIFGRIFKS